MGFRAAFHSRHSRRFASAVWSCRPPLVATFASCRRRRSKTRPRKASGCKAPRGAFPAAASGPRPFRRHVRPRIDPAIGHVRRTDEQGRHRSKIASIHGQIDRNPAVRRQWCDTGPGIRARAAWSSATSDRRYGRHALPPQRVVTVIRTSAPAANPDPAVSSPSSPCRCQRPGGPAPRPPTSGGGGGGRRRDTAGAIQPAARGTAAAPRNWGRYVPNEVVVEVAPNVSPQTSTRCCAGTA